MSTNIKWSHSLRVSLYQAVTTVFGQQLRSGRGKPKGMSKATFLQHLDAIGVAIGVGNDKGGALSNQIAWCYCVPSKACHEGHWNNRKKNIAAAQEGGYTRVHRQVVLPKTMAVPYGEPVTTTKVGFFRRVWKWLTN